jgi:hypothetical protein
LMTAPSLAEMAGLAVVNKPEKNPLQGVSHPAGLDNERTCLVCTSSSLFTS